MGQAEGQDALHKVRRYIIVSIVGTHKDALNVVYDIENCGRVTLGKVRESVYVFGCESCGCQRYFVETESCEDELCGHICETCGCYKSCVRCGNPVVGIETYCSTKCRIQGQMF